MTDARTSHSPGSIVLRAATPADAPLLHHWDEQPHVIQSDPNDDWHWELELPRSPRWRELLIAEIDEQPIGFMQIIDPLLEETQYWGNIAPNLRAIDIWIGDAANLGKGYGTQMMHLALARCFAAPEVTAVIIDPLVSNVRAIRFYQRLGFEPIQRRRFGDDDCLVLEISRARWEDGNASMQ